MFMRFCACVGGEDEREGGSEIPQDRRFPSPQMPLLSHWRRLLLARKDRTTICFAFDTHELLHQAGA